MSIGINIGDEIVYYTRTGSKYHREWCSYLRSSYEITLKAAVKRFSPCSRCNPPSFSPSYQLSSQISLQSTLFNSQTHVDKLSQTSFNNTDILDKNSIIVYKYPATNNQINSNKISTNLFENLSGIANINSNNSLYDKNFISSDSQNNINSILNINDNQIYNPNISSFNLYEKEEENLLIKEKKEDNLENQNKKNGSKISNSDNEFNCTIGDLRKTNSKFLMSDFDLISKINEMVEEKFKKREEKILKELERLEKKFEYQEEKIKILEEKEKKFEQQEEKIKILEDKNLFLKKNLDESEIFNQKLHLKVSNQEVEINYLKQMINKINYDKIETEKLEKNVIVLGGKIDNIEKILNFQTELNRFNKEKINFFIQENKINISFIEKLISTFNYSFEKIEKKIEIYADMYFYKNSELEKFSRQFIFKNNLENINQNIFIKIIKCLSSRDKCLKNTFLGYAESDSLQEALFNDKKFFNNRQQFYDSNSLFKIFTVDKFVSNQIFKNSFK